MTNQRKRLLAYVAITVAFTMGLYRVESQGQQREDQFCLLAERDHLGDVRQLRRTYEYLGNLTPADLKLGDPRALINIFVLRDLPRLEREAFTDKSPSICDEPGWLWDEDTGLPEPNPAIPDRPTKVDKLFKGLRRTQQRQRRRSESSRLRALGRIPRGSAQEQITSRGERAPERQASVPGRSRGDPPVPEQQPTTQASPVSGPQPPPESPVPPRGPSGPKLPVPVPEPVCRRLPGLPICP